MKLLSLILPLLPLPSFILAQWHPPNCDHGRAKQVLLSTGSCCGALSYFLTTKVSYPDTSVYNASLTSYWALQESQVFPACIISPTNAQDVSLSVFLLVTGNAIYPGKCQFAVRSGGHTYFAGSANIESGITIDLKNLNEVTLKPDNSLVRIGPGNRWSDVYSVLDSLKLSTSGGRVSDVGVGGLTLGGGISFFSARYGWVCDNVLNYQIVLATGQIVNANATSHQDLVLALRGGSNNFGIVTAFDMKVFPQGDLWGGITLNPISQRTAQMAAFEAFTGNPNYDPYAALINSYVYLGAIDGWFINNNLEYTQPTPNPAYFSNFTAFPASLSTLRVTNLTALTIEAGSGTPRGVRDIFATSTFVNSAAMMEIIFQLANETAQRVKHIPNITWAISFQPEPTIISGKSNANSLGLDGQPNLFNLLLSAQWATPSDDALVTAQAQYLISSARAAALANGHYNRYIYLNYAADWQDPISGYGIANKARLQSTSRKYDPEGVFQKQCTGGFKLF